MPFQIKIAEYFIIKSLSNKTIKSLFKIKIVNIIFQ